MSTTLHIGKKRVVTIGTSDSSTLPAGAVSVSGGVGTVTTAVDPTTNAVTVTGVQAGTAILTYSAAGYQSVGETFTVAPLPTLTVSDGPEQ